MSSAGAHISGARNKAVAALAQRASNAWKVSCASRSVARAENSLSISVIQSLASSAGFDGVVIADLNRFLRQNWGRLMGAMEILFRFQSQGAFAGAV